MEVAHEAILTEWPTLHRWIGDQREDLLLQRRLYVALGDWEAADQSDAYLLTGGRLSQHLDWAARTELTLTTREIEHMECSREVDEQRRATRRRRRRAVMAGFGIAALVASVLALAATAAQRDAAAQARLAQAESLAANSIVALDSDVELALLLASDALASSPGLSSVAAIHEGLQRHRADMVIPPPEGSYSAMAVINPSGSRVAIVGAGTAVVQMWDVGSTDPSWSVTLTEDEIAKFWHYMHFWFSADGEKLYIPIAPSWPDTGPGVGLYTIDAATGETDSFVPFPCLSRVTPAGTQFVTGSRFAIEWDEPLDPGPDPILCGTDRDVGESFGGVLDVATGDILFKVPYDGGGFPPTLSGDGRLLSLNAGFRVDEGWRTGAKVYDISTGEIVLQTPLLAEDDPELNSVLQAVLSHDGTRILAGKNPTYLKDVESGETLQTYQGTSCESFSRPMRGVWSARTPPPVRSWSSTRQPGLNSSGSWGKTRD